MIDHFGTQIIEFIKIPSITAFITLVNGISNGTIGARWLAWNAFLKIEL